MAKTKKFRTATKREILEFLQNAPKNSTLEEMSDALLPGGGTLRQNLEEYLRKQSRSFEDESVKQQILTVFKLHGNNDKPLLFFDFVSYINRSFFGKVSYQKVASVLKRVADKKVLLSIDINNKRSKQTIYTIKPCYETFVK